MEYELFNTTPNRASNSLEVAMHARAQDHKRAQMIARFKGKAAGAQTGLLKVVAGLLASARA